MEFIMRVLKEYKLLTHKVPSTAPLYDRVVHEGLPPVVVNHMITFLGSSKTQVAGMLGISVRRINQITKEAEAAVTITVENEETEVVGQLQRAKPYNSLNKNASERALLVASAFLKATEHFGSKVKAREWFHYRNMVLGNKTPLEMCNTIIGIRRVENTIVKLEHGMTA